MRGKREMQRHLDNAERRVAAGDLSKWLSLAILLVASLPVRGMAQTPAPVSSEAAPATGSEAARPAADAPAERPASSGAGDPAATPVERAAGDPAPAAAPPPVSAPLPQATAAPAAVAPAPAPGSPPDGSSPVAATPAASAAAPPPPRDLLVTLRPGAHQAAQRVAVHAPFAAKSGTTVTVRTAADGGLNLLAARSAPSDWDLAEVSSDVARRACEAGLLERIDPGLLVKAPDAAAIDKDVIVDGLTPCSVASVTWSSLIAFDQRAWSGGGAAASQAGKTAKRQRPAAAAPVRPPATLTDVFDVATYPGKRALRKSPRYVLEMSLIADGVAPETVYRTLATEEGSRRAFARLERLRGHITWVATPEEAARQLADRAAVMAMLYSGRAFQLAAVEGKPYGLLWDGQIYHLESWVIAKGTPKLEVARAFLAHATSPDRLAAQATLFPYGPARASAVAQVGRHPVLKIEMAPYLPTAPANLRTALQLDERFWETHEKRLAEQFEAWQKGPLPPPEVAPSAPPAGNNEAGKAG